MAKLARPKSRRPNPKKALECLRRAQERNRRTGGPAKGMSEEGIIASIKEKRNARWEAKFAART